MAITLKRQLDDAEKEIILQRHGRTCYATGHTISSDESVHFDHIYAYSKGGASDLNNIAPMCEYHNKRKGTLPLGDYRSKLKLDEFFKLGDKQTLKQFMQYCVDKKYIDSYGNSANIVVGDKTVTIESPKEKMEFHLYECPRTKWKYFYAILPASLIDSDDDYEEESGLQPRYLIFDKVFELYRHLQTYPVLQPSIGRIKNNKILVFDGQHKIASLLLNHRTEFECKIYIEPDVRLLNQANIAAHDKFAQTRFYSSVMILKLGTLFGADFEEYKKIDEESKSEAKFFEYLKQKDPASSKGDISKQLKSYLYSSVLESADNRMKPYITKTNRSTAEQPITIDLLSKSILGNFIYIKPVDDDLLTIKYKRDSELTNTINLLNIMVDEGLQDWDSTRVNDINQLKLKRIFASKSIGAWSELLKDSICAKLDIIDGDERLKPFYRDLTPEDYPKIRNIVSRLFDWQMWQSPNGSNIDTIISGNKKMVKTWFKDKGLTTGYLLGADE